MRAYTSAWIALALILTCRSARADGKRDLEDGIAFYENLDNERAVPRLKSASEATDLPASERARAFLYLGMVDFEVGNPKDAEQHWRKAFALDASSAVPAGTSPKEVQAMEQARKDVKAGKGGTEVKTPPLRVDKPDAGTAPPPPPPPKVDKPDAGALPTVDTHPDNGLGGTPPPPAVDEGGGGPGWILWAGIGAAVVGAAVVAVVLVSRGDCQGSGGCAQIDYTFR